MTNTKLPEFIRRDVERAIEDALHPKGMSTHDGKAHIGVDRLQYLMRIIDGPQNADVLEFLRSFIAGGVNQDFKPWASELYQKLYRSSDEPAVKPVDRYTRPCAVDGCPNDATWGYRRCVTHMEQLDAENREAEPT